MRKMFKKSISVLMVTVITLLTVFSMNIFAETDEIPDGLPVGAYKVQDGIYAVDNFVLPVARSFHQQVNIGTVYPLGQITQPSTLNNFTLGTNDAWICVRVDNAYMRINFVNGNTSIFGSNYNNWPAVGSSSTTTYFIEADYFGFRKSIPYQLQCTAGNGNTYHNVLFSICSSSAQFDWSIVM